MKDSTVNLVILLSASILILYQIIAYIYFFIAVSFVYSKTRKIVKMPGLSLFRAITVFYNMVLFYPLTLSWLSFVASSNPGGDGHINSYDENIFAYKPTPRIIIAVIVIILWAIMLIIQVLSTLFTCEISMQRLVSWSSVEPYTPMLLLLIKMYQAVTITFFVYFFIIFKGSAATSRDHNCWSSRNMFSSN